LIGFPHDISEFKHVLGSGLCKRLHPEKTRNSLTDTSPGIRAYLNRGHLSPLKNVLIDRVEAILILPKISQIPRQHRVSRQRVRARGNGDGKCVLEIERAALEAHVDVEG